MGSWQKQKCMWCWFRVVISKGTLLSSLLSHFLAVFLLLFSSHVFSQKSLFLFFKSQKRLISSSAYFSKLDKLIHNSYTTHLHPLLHLGDTSTKIKSQKAFEGFFWWQFISICQIIKVSPIFFKKQGKIYYTVFPNNYSQRDVLQGIPSSWL